MQFKKMNGVMVLFYGLLLMAGAGCTNAERMIVKEPSSPLHSYQIIEIKSPLIEIPNYDSMDYDHKECLNIIVPKLGDYLHQYLRDSNFKISESGERLIIETKVVDYTPGNRFLRFLIGWGVGKTEMKTVLNFKTEGGEIISTVNFGQSIKMAPFAFGGSTKKLGRILAYRISEYIHSH